MKREQRSPWCFGCGTQNPIGLKLDCREENDKFIAAFTPGPEHQGYGDVVHGGIISTLLDEIMTGYPFFKGLGPRTARLEVQFRRPVFVGQPVTVTGWITDQNGKLMELEGKVTFADGTVAAEGKSTVVLVGDKPLKVPAAGSSRP
ncbi:Thioesterase superfamily protein [Pelotomaculum sp. FP]|uniref:PaaI family thioesterase n=1 Tax=Pelotomaculum sp. FP TaxID=261474 RepID=UPI001064FE72|nr:hotdog fold domain-containing protein [Pelotomaculum sp. FP]TEB13816.1 Thioesterase superfamily protein [Pelotomaculum sp. FP]